jgi:chromosome segregation protein
VLAAEEFTAEEERHRFLTVQRADVARSVESLRATIREINLTSSERFKEAFTLVNEQFSRTFVELFRGGEARCACSTRRTCSTAASRSSPVRRASDCRT